MRVYRDNGNNDVYDEIIRTIRSDRGDTVEADRAIMFVCESVRDFAGGKVSYELVSEASMRQLYQIAFLALTDNEFHNVPSENYRKIVDDNVSADALSSINSRHFWIPERIDWAPIGLFRMTTTIGRCNSNLLENSLATMRRDNRVELVSDFINNQRAETSHIKRVLQGLPQDEVDDIASRSPKVSRLVVVSRDMVQDKIDNVFRGPVSHAKKAMGDMSVHNAIMNDDKLMEQLVKVSISPEAILNVGKSIDVDGEKLVSRFSMMNNFLGYVSINLVSNGNDDSTVFRESAHWSDALKKNIAKNSTDYALFVVSGREDIFDNDRYRFAVKLCVKAIELGMYRAPTDDDYNIVLANELRSYEAFERIDYNKMIGDK